MTPRSCAVKEWALNDEQRALVTENINLIPYTINKFFRPRDDHEWDDLFSIGSIGLCRAAHDYTPDRGVRFSTFAVCCIRTYIQHHYTTLLRSKRDVRKELLIMDQAVGHSLDATGKPDLLVDLLPDKTVDVERQVSDALDWDTLRGNLDAIRLTDRERQVLDLRLDGLLFSEIADRLGLTRSRVGQIFQTVLYKLRMRLPDEYREQVNH